MTQAVALSLLAFGVACGAPPSAAVSTESVRARTSAPPSEPPPEPTSREATFSSLPRALVVLEPEGLERVVVRVEVASSDRAISRGLMWRRTLAPDAGMLFVFEASSRQSFWMRNTYVPLDMIFIDEALRVAGVVEDAEPLTDDERAVEAESRYVLEVRAGFARAHNIVTGTRVRFDGLPEESDP